MTDFILQTTGLKRSFAGIRAVDGVDLAVRRGSIHAVIGPNGAGKTTLFNLLTKFLEPTEGRILLRGEDITAAGPAQIASLGMVRSFQISSVFTRLTALQNVRVALMRRGGHSFHFWRSHRDLDRHNQRAMELLAAVGLERWAHERAARLPYGRKRALEIATTLALEPDVLLLDEPLAGMGQEDVEQVAALIKSLAGPRTVLLVEHNLKVIAQLADVITVMARGRVIAEGPYATVSQNPEVRSAYLGSSHA
ncbi:ABC transporter ATP-binding protein [Rhodoferax sediminis]|uniref:ABC transporter ATP-binding protein n=1 Tax=Rhodoferax sediminis TaxID=2509614 RepID=A0A515DDZ2_9BURK|nr:ABC transporter ATP-binding protein [Rhodoferax sediminis]QDL38617.1 ABC transporter ATP-binding protein [Rhodoferax sediminis]